MLETLSAVFELMFLLFSRRSNWVEGEDIRSAYLYNELPLKYHLYALPSAVAYVVLVILYLVLGWSAYFGVNILLSVVYIPIFALLVAFSWPALAATVRCIPVCSVESASHVLVYSKDGESDLCDVKTVWVP